MNQLPSDKSTRGFSMVELLCAIAVMSILVGAATPSINSVLESNSVTQSGQRLVSQIVMARQLAAARSTVVEVRLIKLKSTDVGYTAIQLYAVTSGGTLQAISPVVSLQDRSVVADSSLSPFLSSMSSGVFSTGSGVLSNATYKSFRIRPSGMIEPIPASASRANLYFTIVGKRYANSQTAPVNYFTVQLNPDTASPLLYRP